MKSAMLKILGVVLFAFLPLPIVVVAVSSFVKNGYFTMPLAPFSLRWYEEFLRDDQWTWLLLTSAGLAVVVALVSTLLALLAALVLNEKSFKGSGLVENLVMLPLVFPNAALGVAFLGMAGLLGISGSYLGIVLAHCIITLPFAYRPILNSLRKIDGSMSEAAMSLGSTPGRVLWTVILPLIRPGLITAFIFCFIISFDEATVTIFLVGPEVTTLPIRILTEIQERGSPVIAAISTFLVLITIAIVIFLERTVGLELFSAPEKKSRP